MKKDYSTWTRTDLTNALESQQREIALLQRDALFLKKDVDEFVRAVINLSTPTTKLDV